MDFDQLFATAGQVPPPVRRARPTGGRTPYELALMEQALRTYVETPEFLRPPIQGETREGRGRRLAAIEAYRQSHMKKERPDWGTKVHHVQDLDPVRDAYEEDDGSVYHDGQSYSRDAIDRIGTAVGEDASWLTLYDGLPADILRDREARDLDKHSDDRGIQERRAQVAAALRRYRQQAESMVLTMLD